MVVSAPLELSLPYLEGGGANKTTDEHRLALTFQYNEPWARTDENFLLTMPLEEQLKVLHPKAPGRRRGGCQNTCMETGTAGVGGVIVNPLAPRAASDYDWSFSIRPFLWPS